MKATSPFVSGGGPALVLYFPITYEASVPKVLGTLLSHGIKHRRRTERTNLGAPAGRRDICGNSV